MLADELKSLKGEVVKYAGLVESMLSKSILGLMERRESILFEVILDLEEKANKKESMIDSTCIELLAKYSPKASNLRTIIMIMKMSNDLERMADHTVNISRSALEIIEGPELKAAHAVNVMLEDIVKMINCSINAFIELDKELAKKVCEMDDKVNKQRDEILKDMLNFMTIDNTYIERAVQMINISRNLERIADLATNIAEGTYYIICGESIKHKKNRIN